MQPPDDDDDDDLSTSPLTTPPSLRSPSPSPASGSPTVLGKHSPCTPFSEPAKKKKKKTRRSGKKKSDAPAQPFGSCLPSSSGSLPPPSSDSFPSQPFGSCPPSSSGSVLPPSSGSFPPPSSGSFPSQSSSSCPVQSSGSLTSSSSSSFVSPPSGSFTFSSSTFPSLSSSSLPSPSSSSRPLPSSSSHPPPPPSSEQRQLSYKHLQRSLKRKKTWSDPRIHLPSLPKSATSKVVENTAPLATPLDSNVILDNTSGYVGTERVVDGDGRVWKLSELIGPDSKYNFKYCSYDSSVAAVPICDSQQRVIGVVVGPPVNETDWTSVIKRAAHIIVQARQKLSFDAKYLVHRRGRFQVLPVGISYGGGQQYAKRIWHRKSNCPIIEGLLGSNSIRRLAGHASQAFKTWAPRLFAYYEENLGHLLNDNPSLYPNFTNSIWACATFNFGPQTVTVQHLDHLNYIFGWCGITVLGDFDYRKGGHFVLWDLGLVIELPPGCTILIPSAYIRHSNTLIGKGETRYSFTQYTAGGLFRWVDDDGKVRAQMSKEDLKKAYERQREHINESMNLYSTLNELRSQYNVS
ncbi:hypothetical protein VKT23_019992 [Stygiomarasmius scandens]|uniref:Uncharacterized protein n=1 Tax=Marasmiellus scandens TaxID=2682957 RepID=A0ABR1IJX7_9AGAR